MKTAWFRSCVCFALVFSMVSMSLGDSTVGLATSLSELVQQMRAKFNVAERSLSASEELTEVAFEPPLRMNALPGASHKPSGAPTFPVGEVADSILGHTGRLSSKITKQQVENWHKVAGDPKQSKDRRLWAGLWLAEFELAGNEQPVSSEKYFQELVKRAPKNHPVYGLSRLGIGLSLFGQGRYGLAEEELKSLVSDGAPGVSLQNVAAMAKHAQACFGYHLERKVAGIVEPESLDPLCGASSLAIVFRKLGLPHDKPRMEKLVRHTGFGSNLQDVIDAANKQGLVARALQVSDEGLRVILKESGGTPLVVRVEHDHFIAVTAADEAGVTYSCSDCAPWPGGRQRVNWKQWRLMEPDAYAAFAKPKTTFGEALLALEVKPETEAFLRLIQPSPMIQIRSTEVQRMALALRDADVSIFLLAAFVICGLMQYMSPCYEENCTQFCPPTATSLATQDPVNLANGTEVHTAPADLSIYNPAGPGVAWTHSYTSMSSPVPNGFGSAWTHPYLWTIRLAVGGTAPGHPGSVPVILPPLPGGGGGGGGEGNSMMGGGEEGGGEDPPPPTTSGGYIIFPNSATTPLTFASGTAPTTSNPLVSGTLPNGQPYVATWKYDASANGGDVIELKTAHRETYTFKQQGTLSSPNTDRHYYLARITDAVGNWIDLNWTGPYYFRSYNIWTRTKTAFALSTITDKFGAALLTLGYNFGADYTRITSASDRYGRSIYYTVLNFPNENVPPSSIMPDNDELTQASTLVATGTPNPGVRWSYTYENVYNWESTKVPFLKSISTISPTGSGLSTATIYYNPYGYVSRLVDASGNQQVITELAGNNTKVSVKDPSNNIVEEYQVSFDSLMNLTGVKNASGTSVLSLSYGDPHTPFRPSSAIDGNGRVYAFDWDEFNQPLTTTTPKVTTTFQRSYTNYPLGELTSVQEGSKTSTTFTYYQPSGLVETVNSPIPGQTGTGSRQTTTFTYDALGNVTSVVSPGNNAGSTRTSTFNYTTDGGYSTTAKLGQPVAITDPLGKVTHLRYDARGNVTSAWDALGNTSTYTYNIADQTENAYAPATGQTGSGNARSQSIYQFPGGLVSQAKAYSESGALIRTVSMTYGPEAQLLTRTGDTEPVTLSYNAAYRVTSVKDGNNHATGTVYTYNTLGQVTSVKHPNVNTGTGYDYIRYTSYDPVGNLLSRTDGRNVVTNYQYLDAEGLLTNINYPATPSKNVTATFDTYSRLSTLADGEGTASYSYDDLDLALTGSRQYTGLPNKSFSYAYYADGAQQSMTTPAGTWTYYYDLNGRYTSMTSPAGTSSATYYDNGWQATRVLPNGARTEYGYNAVGAPSSILNKDSLLANRSSWSSFTYDGVFNLKSVVANIVPQTSYNGTVAWNYDTRDRMTQEGSTGNRSYTHGFGYDGASNPTTFKGVAQTFNADNQRSASGYVYDGNGNPTTYGGTTLTFDAENRMTAYGSTATYGYRADNLRAWKQVGSTRTYYLYDGGNPIIEMDSSGNTTAVNAYAPDGLVGRQSGGTWTYYQFDQQGNVAHRLTAGDAVSSSSWYDAYGVETASSTPTDPFGYNAQWGYQFDRETGKYYCQNRYYDPAQGRWFTRDPIGFAGGLNLYGYCGGGPVGVADPSGLKIWDGYDDDNPAYRAISNLENSWNWAMDRLGRFLKGEMAGGAEYYGPDTAVAGSLQKSRGGQSIRSQLPSGAVQGDTVRGTVGTIPAFVNTICEPWNGVQAFIGAFSWQATRNGDRWEVTARNDTGLNSLLYHITEKLGIKDPRVGPMARYPQTYEWYEP